jgi:hypothetical protein
MKTCKVKFKGITPYSQSKPYEVPKLPQEIAKDYETRTWAERMHYDGDGNVFIPLTSIKNCLSEAAKYLAMQVPGKGKSTYTKHFEAGIIVQDNIPLRVKKDKAENEWCFVPSDGRRGSGSRVWKCFPIFRKWEGETIIIVLDDIITRDVMDAHLKASGAFIGLGRFRPRNNGYYGRFEAEIMEWK